MCGIAGVWRRDSITKETLRRMAGVLRHRGPDSDGVHTRGQVGLAVRRLRVIDLKTGDQPVTSACSGATIVYNGEVYNYLELGQQLEARGHRLKTKSDTEVVLHFYEEFGPEGFDKLNGMFAFAIDDPNSDALILARDHLGVKPLYYWHANDQLVFGSEVKAVLASGLPSASINRRALANYLTYGHSVANETIYQGIRKVPPGHTVVFRDGRLRFVKFWDLIDNAQRWDPDAPPPTEQVEMLLSDSVRRNMLADVPVGAFLSGGIDSSLVTALMKPHAHELRTYSVGFGAGGFNELPDALRIASALQTHHTPVLVTAADAAEALPALAKAYDEPFADSAAVPTYLLAKRARQDVTVVLTGEGGDELFGGYRRYVAEQAFGAYRLVPSQIRTALAGSSLDRLAFARRAGRTLRALSKNQRASRASVWIELFSTNERSRLMGNEEEGAYEPYAAIARKTEALDDDVVALMALEMQTNLVDAYLEKVDKATMAVSLEARVPMLDPRLVELMALAPRHWKVDGLKTKVLLKRIASHYLPPASIRKRKQGFGPPVGLWLRGELRDRIRAMAEPDSAIGALLTLSTVRDVINAFLRGEHRGAQVWALLMLDEWAQAYRGSGSEEIMDGHPLSHPAQTPS